MVSLRRIASKYGLEGVILFGSRVKGAPRKESDLDVCVVAPHFHGDEVDLINDLGQVFRAEVDLSFFHRASPSLKCAVALQGKLVYGDRRRFERLRLAAIKEWQDSRKLAEAADAYIAARLR
ncbi:MAG: nucleotidyltransferase domain-containing protein [Planctomycetes bacterium]|nr:nucleotidyltransferase domain-containing protein [Planctomycetota bacterium]